MAQLRVTERLDELYAIGAGEGANRPGLGRREQAACELVAGWMAAAGLEVSWDAAGNLYGRSRGERPELPELWTGSHLDTVPEGGRFDGALGVVAGLEAVGRLHPEARTRTLAAVAFRDEEGSRFGGGTFGSLALCGRLGPNALDARDAQGTTVREALAALGLGEPPLGGWLDPPPAAFVEAHVEQGPVLERLGAPLGVVTAIAAMTRFTREFEGAAGHAGTTPMNARDDALCSAAEYVLAVREAAREIGGAVATVGTLTIDPGAVNVSPARAALTVDARAPDRARHDELLQALGERPAVGATTSQWPLHRPTRCGRRSHGAACPPSTSSRAPATMRPCSPQPASRPRCGSCGASPAASATRRPKRRPPTTLRSASTS